MIRRCLFCDKEISKSAMMCRKHFLEGYRILYHCGKVIRWAVKK